MLRTSGVIAILLRIAESAQIGRDEGTHVNLSVSGRDGSPTFDGWHATFALCVTDIFLSYCLLAMLGFRVLCLWVNVSYEF